MLVRRCGRKGDGICKRRKLWHRLAMRPMLRLVLTAIVVFAGATSATAGDRIRLAVQKTGTLAWELDVIKTHGLDRKLDLVIEPIELASTEAGKIALKGGSADLMLSDWLWVARERSLGDGLVFYPSSSTLGAVMVPAQSAIRELADLKGKKLAVAGGPLDKSWLLLQALARRAGIDLRKQATVVYGAPPLLAEKALQGEIDATLTFWNFCADLESRGLKRAIAMDDVMKGLGAKGPVAIVGYTFDSGWAARNRSTVDRFLEAIAEVGLGYPVLGALNVRLFAVNNGEDDDIKVQAKDCNTGGTFQLETDFASQERNVQSSAIHYCLLDSVSGRLFFTNGPLLGYDSPEVSHVINWGSNQSTWAVGAGGRIGMVTGEDAQQALALTGRQSSCGR